MRCQCTLCDIAELDILYPTFKSSPYFAFNKLFCNLLYVSSRTLFGGRSCPGLSAAACRTSLSPGLRSVELEFVGRHCFANGLQDFDDDFSASHGSGVHFLFHGPVTFAIQCACLSVVDRLVDEENRVAIC